MIYKKQKIIALFLLFFHFFSILFLSFISTVKAIENAEVAGTMAGIQALLEQDRKDSYSAIQRTPEYSRSSSKNSQENNNIKKSLPDLGNNPALLEKNNETILTGSVSQLGNILSNDNSMDAAINYAKSIGEGLVNQRITDFFRQYGTSRISISTDKKISGDFLLPVIDNTNSLLFTQLGLRTNKDRNTLNLGLGYRQYWGDWMYGINTFYDYDYSGGNARLGLGGEAWTDYLKLAANGYFGLTDWHQSKIAVMDDYDERPATGFDVRAEAYLPTYPKLGGSIKYEKYFGKGVHLGTGVDPDKLKDDPYALTLGINYTPIPLIALKGEHAAGDRNDTMVGMDIIYRFGVPLSQQLDPDAVDVMRSLVGNKYDFVDRNYDIVMQYRKQELINISLPAEMRAEAKETLIIPATINKTKYGLKKINWTVSPNFIANGGSYQIISPTQLEIILPAYVYKTQSNAAQEYQISAVGIDNNDNESNRATTIIRVKPSKNVVNDLIVEPNATLPANNQDRFTTTAVITNEHGQPLPQQVITFHVDGLKQPNGQSGVTLFSGTQSASNGKVITATTDNQGKAVIYISSKVAGEGKITAKMENGNYKNGQLKFSADRNSAQIAKLNVTKDKALADGKEKNMLYALVTDQNGNAVENIAVNLTATNGAIIENGATANTNQRGELIFGVTSTKAGSSEVTVEINGSQKTLSVVFVTGHPSAEKSLLTVQPATIVANGKTVANLKLELKDAQGNPISGGKVDFTTSLANSRTSDTKDMGNGVYTAELTGITAGETTVGVKINGSVLKNKTAKVVLTADSDNPSPTKSKLEAKPDKIVADGKAVSTLKLTLQDVNGNLISGQSVKFNTTLANSSATPVTENGPGIYTASLTGTKTGKTEISVEVAGKLLTVSPVIVILTADSGNVSGEKSQLTAAPSTVVANGVETSTLTLVLKDINDNLLGGQKVNFTSNLAKSQTSGTKETSEGVYSATLTGTQAGEAVIGVEVNGNVLNMTVVTKVTLIADSTKPGADKSKLEATPNRIVANGTGSSVIKLTLKDINGNAIVGETDQVKFTTSLANSKVDETVEESSGVYTAKLTGTTAGESKIGVEVNGAELSVTPVAVTLTADSSKPGADKSTLEANPTRIVADGSAFSTLKLILQDVNGNAISGLKDKVKFITPLKNSKIGDTVEENNGVYTAKLSGKTAGETTIGVEVNGQLLIVSRVLKVNLSADGSKPSADKSILAANPSSIVADGKISSTITLELKDVNGNPLAEQGVEFIPSLPGSEIGKVTEKDNGIYEASLVGTKAGQTTISVGVNGKALVGKTATVTLTADNSKPSKDKSKLEADTIEIVADGQASSTIKLTLLDVNDNPLAGQKVKFNSSLKNSHASDQVKDEGNGIYTATLTGTTAGETSIEVIVNGAVLQIKNSAKITFTADKKHPSKDKSILAANPSSIVADGKETSTLKLTLMDVHDNPIEDEKVKFISSLPNSDFDEVQNKGKGVYTAKFKGKTAGVSKIKVRVNDQELAIKTEVTLTADSKTAVLKKVRLEGDSNSKVADGVNTFTFIAVVKDANDNPVMGQDVRWKKNKEKNVFLPEISEPTDVKGETKIILTSTKKAVADILVIANKDGIELNAEKVSFTADSKNAKIKLTWKKKDEWVLANNKDKNIVDVLVYDVNENPVPNAEISIHVPSGLTSSSERVETNKEGFSSFNITSNAYGLHQVEGKVTSSNSTDSVKVIFIPETFDLTIKVSNK